MFRGSGRRVSGDRHADGRDPRGAGATRAAAARGPDESIGAARRTGSPRGRHRSRLQQHPRRGGSPTQSWQSSTSKKSTPLFQSVEGVHQSVCPRQGARPADPDLRSTQESRAAANRSERERTSGRGAAARFPTTHHRGHGGPSAQSAVGQRLGHRDRSRPDEPGHQRGPGHATRRQLALRRAPRRGGRRSRYGDGPAKSRQLLRRRGHRQRRRHRRRPPSSHLRALLHAPKRRRRHWPGSFDRARHDCRPRRTPRSAVRPRITGRRNDHVHALPPRVLGPLAGGEAPPVRAQDFDGTGRSR